jgi:hypothetical protein
MFDQWIVDKTTNANSKYMILLAYQVLRLEFASTTEDMGKLEEDSVVNWMATARRKNGAIS